jgi:hypothetical protein
MMKRVSMTWCTLSLLATAAPAMADPVAAESCAKTLSPAALQIYRAAAPDVKPNSNMPHLLRSKVMPMVMSGDMTVKIARPAAMAASFCLRDLQQLPGVEVVANSNAGFRQAQ